MGRDIFLLMGGAASVALIYGGVRLMRRAGEASKGRLMIIAAVVLIANLIIVGWPVS